MCRFALRLGRYMHELKNGCENLLVFHGYSLLTILVLGYPTLKLNLYLHVFNLSLEAAFLSFAFLAIFYLCLSMMASRKWSGRSTAVVVADRWWLDIDCDLLKVGGRGSVGHIGCKV